MTDIPDGQRAYYTSDGIMHVNGAVCMAEKRHLEPTVRRTIPIIDSAGDAPKIVLAPLPTFVTGPCCSDATHALNAGTDSYRDAIQSNPSNLTRNLKELLNKHGIRRNRTLNAASTIMGAPAEATWTGNVLTLKAYDDTLKSICMETSTVTSKQSIPPPLRQEKRRHYSEPDTSRRNADDDRE